MLREQDFHKASKCYPTDYVLITKGEMLPLGWRDLVSPFMLSALSVVGQHGTVCAS